MWQSTTLNHLGYRRSQSSYHRFLFLEPMGKYNLLYFILFPRTGLILLKSCKNWPWWFCVKGENRSTQVVVHDTKPPTNSHLHSFKFQEESRYDQSPVFQSHKLKHTTWMIEFWGFWKIVLKIEFNSKLETIPEW